MPRKAQDQKLQQPRDISPDIAIEPALFKAGMHAELQKFGNKRRDEQAEQQLALFGQDEVAEEQLETTGLDLSIPEDRAFSALQILLDRTQYAGNQEGEAVVSESYKFDGTVPRLSMTYGEYFEAYGLERASDGRYHGNQVQEALEALNGLTRAQRICYIRRTTKGNGSKSQTSSDLIVHLGPIITITEEYRDLSDDEVVEIVDGVTLPYRVQRLLIGFSPLLIESIDSFYLLKPTTLHREIQRVLGPRRRVSRVYSLFIEWLLTLDMPVMRIHTDNLIEKMRLDHLLKHRQRNRAEQRLTEACQLAVQLEYLLAFDEEDNKIICLRLNPDRCLRIGAKQNKLKAATITE